MLVKARRGASSSRITSITGSVQVGLLPLVFLHGTLVCFFVVGVCVFPWWAHVNFTRDHLFFFRRPTCKKHKLLLLEPSVFSHVVMCFLHTWSCAFTHVVMCFAHMRLPTLDRHYLLLWSPLPRPPTTTAHTTVCITATTPVCFTCQTMRGTVAEAAVSGAAAT